MMKKLYQPFFISLSALLLAFLFFIFKEYHKAIFAFRILGIDILGLMTLSFLFYILSPNYKSILKRSLLIVFCYFTTYEIIDTMMYLSKYHRFTSVSLTDIVEIETAIVTFIFTFLLGLLFQMSQKKAD